MGVKDSVSEFVTDFKAMIKNKDMTQVNEKYLRPTWAQTKVVAGKTWDVVVENTPKVVAAGKEAVHKAQEMISEYSKKSPKGPEDPTNSQNTPESKPSEPKNKV